MRIALIADTFPPLRSSGAVQLRDLSKEFARQGHTVTVLLPSSKQKHPWSVEQHDGVEILRLKTLPTKNIGYIRRTIAELLMPFTMLWQYKKSPLANEKWDGVVWYSPSIFLGPIANTLKKSSNCKGYLIVRDIFPEWALDMNLIGRIPFYFFKMVAKYQYSVADVIGIQTPGNKHYFDLWLKKSLIS
jgi:glycosyltransferase involved in cell wall biosynthesis